MGGLLSRWSPSTIHLILFALGGGLVFVGQEFAWPWAAALGLAVIGLFLVVIGIDILVRRLGVLRIDGWSREKVVDTYRGVGELLWSIVLICLGLVMAAIVTMNWFGPVESETFWTGLLNTPSGLGAILAFVGLMMLLSGLVRALAGSGSVDPRRLTGIPYALDRLAGALTFLFGALISAAGLLVLLAPDVVRGALDGIKDAVLGT